MSKNPPALTFGAAAVTMTSREIADLTGKAHHHVLRDIRSMVDELAKDDPKLDDRHREDKDARGYTAMFHLDRELTDTLLTGYSAVARRKVVARWHELEAGGAVGLPNFADPAVAARAWAEQFEQKQIAVAQRDAAVRTKALIGSKREATAMATAAAATRRANRLEDELGHNLRHATVTAVEKALGRKFGKQDWRPLRQWSRDHGLQVASVTDPRYGEVKAWPAEAWKAVHGVDLQSIFPQAEQVAH